jgi:hypothetical protein
MRRLRDKRTGEVYGWGPAMAAIPTMEEFDDGGEDPDATGRPPSGPSWTVAASWRAGTSSIPAST